MRGHVSPGTLAYADQLRAVLAELVADKRTHDAAGCKIPGVKLDVEGGCEACNGFLADLLRLAIVELAHTNYRTK